MSTEEEHQKDLAKVRWVAGSAFDLELDNGKPTVIMANEVPDAIRTNVARNSNGVLGQKFVAVDNGKLTERWLPLTDEVRAYIEKYEVAIEPGREVAISTDVVELQRRLCRLIRRGGMISVDYGEDGPTYFPNTPWTPRPIETSFGQPVGRWWKDAAVRTYPRWFNPLEIPALAM
jgi:SAM-dependent MidA family methyltransferase